MSGDDPMFFLTQIPADFTQICADFYVCEISELNEEKICVHLR